MRQLKISTQTTDRSSISVEKYLNDVSKIALLTPGEETELTALIQATGDERAKTRLINANLRFVISVAKQYQGSGLTLEDLIAAGNMGLMKAADRFDPTRGFKFISFAVWWIRQMILQEIATTGRTIYQPSNKTGKWGQVRKAMRKLEQILEREPTMEEIAEHMEQTVEFVKDIMQTQGQTTSYDVPISNDGSPETILSLMKDTSSEMADSFAIHGETQRELLTEMSKHLTARQLQAVTWYYGIGCMPKSLVEISEEYGITREGSRQTLEAGMKRLRNRKELFNELFYNA